MDIGPGFTLLGWALLLGLVVYVANVLAQRAQRRDARVSLVLVAALLVGGLVASTLGAGLVFVNPEERGVVLSMLSPSGYRSQALQPGLNWIVPYFEKLTRRYSISRQTYTMSIVPQAGQAQGDDSILARTIDGQEVTVDASVIFTIDPAKVLDVHIRWQDRYIDGLVRPLARGVIRDAVAMYKVEEVVSTERLKMTDGIFEEMSRRMGNEGFVVVDFILRNITFSDEYAASVERKQIAQQEAEQAKYLVQKQEQEAARMRVEAEGVRDAAITRAEGEARAQVVRAEADAEALRLISQALEENPDLLTYRYIEKLAPNVGVMILPAGGSSGTPFIIDLKQMLPESISPTAP
ncbi:MAG: prohibitin family protein [Thermoflexales bacterium]|nr:prohibitin family protein [Thermoflexales bacterium]